MDDGGCSWCNNTGSWEDEFGNTLYCKLDCTYSQQLRQIDNAALSAALSDPADTPSYEGLPEAKALLELMAGLSGQAAQKLAACYLTQIQKQAHAQGMDTAKENVIRLQKEVETLREWARASALPGCTCWAGAPIFCNARESPHVPPPRRSSTPLKDPSND